MRAWGRVCLVGAFALSIAALFLAMWIVVPAPTRVLLPLAVGAPELSAWIVIASLVALLLAAGAAKTSRSARAAFVFALAALLLGVSPFVRFAGASRAALAEWRRAAPQFDEVAFVASGAVPLRAPIDVATLLAGLSADRVTRPSRVTRAVPFAVRGGEMLTVDVYAPVDSVALNSPERPVLVQVYGGAWQRGEPSDFAEFAEYFAARGWVVFAVDYRHAPLFRYPAQLDDVREAISWIGTHAAQYGADTSRMVLIGRSAGAHLAMLAAYTPGAPRVRGVISYYGPVDLVEGYRAPPSPDPLDVRAVERAFIGGTPAQLPEAYRSASPISFAGTTQPPTLLVYGGRDHIVEPRFGRQLRDSLRAHDTPVVHVEIPWAEHAFDAVPHGPSGQLARYITERFAAWVITRE